MELIWLEDFLALAEAGNFSRAAQARHVTQPAFSRRIRALEDWTGAPLFDRSTHRITLTGAGQAFQPAAAETLSRLYQGREDAREAGGREAAGLRFAATHALSFTFFPQWLRQFEAVAVSGKVELASDTMQACEQAMMQGQAQFLLCHAHAAVPNRLDPARFVSAVAGHDVLVPVSAPDAGGNARFVLPGTASARVPLLTYSSASGLGRIIAAVRGTDAAPAFLEEIFTSHLAAVLRTMALAGHGAAWIPLSLVDRDIKSGALLRAGGVEWDIPVEIRLFRPIALQSKTAEALWPLVPAG
jgi:DNA-binding transcriptional LysR family regulator